MSSLTPKTRPKDVEQYKRHPMQVIPTCRPTIHISAFFEKKRPTSHWKTLEKKDPLTHRETLVILERIFDIILELDKLRDDQPPPDMEQDVAEWFAACLSYVTSTHFLSGRQIILRPRKDCMTL